MKLVRPGCYSRKSFSKLCAGCCTKFLSFILWEISKVSVIIPNLQIMKGIQGWGNPLPPFGLGESPSHTYCPRIIVKLFFHSQKFGIQVIWSPCVRVRAWVWVNFWILLKMWAGGVCSAWLSVFYFCPATRLHSYTSKAWERLPANLLSPAWALLARPVLQRIKSKKWSCPRRGPFGYMLDSFIHIFHSFTHLLPAHFLQGPVACKRVTGS